MPSVAGSRLNPAAAHVSRNTSQRFHPSGPIETDFMPTCLTTIFPTPLHRFRDQDISISKNTVTRTLCVALPKRVINRVSGTKRILTDANGGIKLKIIIIICESELFLLYTRCVADKHLNEGLNKIYTKVILRINFNKLKMSHPVRSCISE